MALTRQWQKSTHSAATNCAKVRLTGDGLVQMGDTKQSPAAPVLTFTPGEWNAFLGGVKDGEFDLA